MAYNASTALDLVKARMERAGVTTPAPLLSYWTIRIEAAAKEIENTGIHLQDTADDNALVADLAVERINNRDNKAGDPEWIRHAIRQRWFQERAEATV